jgi:hypothetical protein
MLFCSFPCVFVVPLCFLVVWPLIGSVLLYYFSLLHALCEGEFVNIIKFFVAKKKKDNLDNENYSLVRVKIN